MKRIILFLACCIVPWNLLAQLSTNEQPYELKDGFKEKSQELIVLPEPDKESIEKEDLVNDQKPGLMRYAYPVRVNFTMDNSGVWQQLDDGSKIWRLKVNIPGALSTNTYYDKFWLPDGCKFFIYSEDTKQFIGAITSDYIDGSRDNPIEFATAIIYGENVVYEYYQPYAVKESPIIFISRIDYGYRYVNNPYCNNRIFGSADWCSVNINCPEGNNWQAEKHAVARISVPIPGEGSFWASCALVNNTKNDFKPYVLTADHCLTLGEGGGVYGKLDAITKPDAKQWIFYWQYEHPGCNNSTIEPSTTNMTTVGATVVANDTLSDFALLLLKQDPRNAMGATPYYLGWDRSGNAGTGGVGIHHPGGDVKKISTYTMTPQSTNRESNTVNANGNYWRVIWIPTTTNHGVTQWASSGSPLINSNQKVIGQLWGGFANCDETINEKGEKLGKNEPDWYGKFSVSWNGGGNPDHRRRLDYWLAPGLINPPQTLSGSMDCTLIGLSSFFIGQTESFTVTNPPMNYTWSCSSNLTPGSVSGNTKSFTANNAGYAWVAVNLGSTQIVKYDITIFSYAPYISCINGLDYVIYNQSGSSSPATDEDYTVVLLNTVTPPYSYSWGMEGNSSYYSLSPNGNSVKVTFNIDFDWSFKLYVNAYNSYGSDYAAKYITFKGSQKSGSAPKIYPNPVSDILYIEIDQDTIDRVLALLQNKGSKSFNSVPVFDIRLYNGQNILLMKQFTKGGITQFNVSDLPDGIYYLHIYNGVLSKPEMYSIIVKH